MSSRLVIEREQFPGLVPLSAQVGSRMTFVVTGWLRRDEASAVDTTSIGGPTQYLLGGSEVELLVEEIEVIKQERREQ